jgi:hypothetical protein
MTFKVKIIGNQKTLEFKLENGSLAHVKEHVKDAITFFDPIQIEADKVELHFILNSFKNIPYSTAKTQRWSGAWARIILDNLP